MRKATNNAAAPVAIANATATPGTPAANAPVSTVPFTGAAHKYGTNAAAVPCAHANYKLTAAATAPGAGAKGGKPTVWQAVIAAAKAAGATATTPATGLAIVTAMQTNAAVLALLGQTRATKYVGASKVPCPAWCSGYVTGAARNPHLWLAKA